MITKRINIPMALAYPTIKRSLLKNCTTALESQMNIQRMTAKALRGFIFLAKPMAENNVAKI